MSQYTLNQNQFAQTPMLGQVSMIPNPSIVSAQFNPSSSAVLQNGSAVKLITGTSAGLLIDAVSGPTDGPVFGTVIYNLRKNLYNPGDVVEVATAGSYTFLETSAAVVRGAKVTSTAATTGNDPTVATVSSASTQYVTGVAVDTATGAGQLIRVDIAPSLNGAV